MRHIIWHKLLAAALFLSTFSCTEIIDIDLKTTYKRLVVYGIITSDSAQHFVELTATTDYFYQQPPPPIEDARITVSFDDKAIQLTESDTTPGLYFFPESLRGIPGTKYELLIEQVDINGDGISEIYEASTRMPKILPADSITLLKFNTPFFSGYQVAYWGPDPPEKNYYNFKLLRNQNLINRRLSDYTVQPDDFFKENYISGLPIGFLDDEEENEQVYPGDTVTVEVNSITADYYNFIFEAQNEIFGNNPLFSGPPANVSSNISNGAMGIFTAYSTSRVSKIVPSPDE